MSTNNCTVENCKAAINTSAASNNSLFQSITIHHNVFHFITNLKILLINFFLNMYHKSPIARSLQRDIKICDAC